MKELLSPLLSAAVLCVGLLVLAGVVYCVLALPWRLCTGRYPPWREWSVIIVVLCLGLGLFEAAKSFYTTFARKAAEAVFAGKAAEAVCSDAGIGDEEFRSLVSRVKRTQAALTAREAISRMDAVCANSCERKPVRLSAQTIRSVYSIGIPTEEDWRRVEKALRPAGSISVCTDACTQCTDAIIAEIYDIPD